jgi:UDP-GlcNAc:undecaprenyl-phosphate GlcNAc-1-phosphate transferase
MSTYYPFPHLFLFGFAISLATVPLMRRLAFWLGTVDYPAHRKSHALPTPYLGGGAVFLGLASAFLILAVSGLDSPVQREKAAFLLAASLGAMVIGFLDDRWQLKARHKLAGQALVATLFAWAGYRFQVLHVPGLPPWDLQSLSLPFTVFWILAVTNALNLIDGVDGLAGSVAAVLLSTLAWAGARLGEPAITWLCLAGLGGVLGFLVFNWKPASIYLGDAGSTGLGMLVAVCGLALGQGGPGAHGSGSRPEAFPLQFCLLTLALAYPLLDTSLAVARRLLRGNPVGRADRSHIHHRLMARGLKAPDICLVAAAYSLAGGFVLILGLNRPEDGLVPALILAGLTLTGLAWCGYGKLLLPRSIRRLRPHYGVVNHLIAMQKAKIELALHPLEVVALVDQVCLELGVLYCALFLYSPHLGHPVYIGNWERPQSKRRENSPSTSRLFHDRTSDGESSSRAFWCFQTPAQDGDLDVEYRVLMHEFMLHALNKAEALYVRTESELLQAFLRESLGQGGPLRQRLERETSARIQRHEPLSTAELKERFEGETK